MTKLEQQNRWSPQELSPAGSGGLVTHPLTWLRRQLPLLELGSCWPSARAIEGAMACAVCLAEEFVDPVEVLGGSRGAACKGRYGRTRTAKFERT